VVEVKCRLIRQPIYKTTVSVIKEYMIPLVSEQSEPQKSTSSGNLILSFVVGRDLSLLGTPAVVTASDDK
jgi:hypothetical protein